MTKPRLAHNAGFSREGTQARPRWGSRSVTTTVQAGEPQPFQRIPEPLPLKNGTDP